MTDWLIQCVGKAEAQEYAKRLPAVQKAGLRKGIEVLWSSKTVNFSIHVRIPYYGYEMLQHGKRFPL